MRRVLALALALPACLGLAAADTPLPQALDALVARYHAAGLFNGTALVVRDGRVLLEKGYGMASFEQGVANGPGTLHWFGSVSKLVTATTVLRLVDQGRLRLDAKVSDLLPGYRKDTGAQVTLAMLLNHTSGIPDYLHLPGSGREGFAREVGPDPIDRKAFVRRWCSGDLQFQPGSRWSYSNSGYVLLGAIVEQVTGEPFERVVRREVLDPAGMAGTLDMAAQPRAVVPGLTPGYQSLGTRLVTRPAWNLSTTFAAGGLVGPVRDLYRFEQLLDRPGYLSPTARAALLTEGQGHWGCGFEVRTLPLGPERAPRVVQGHEGYLFWSLARFYRIPQDRVFVALVNNTGDAPLASLFEGIGDLLYDRIPALPKPSVARALRQALDQGGPAGLAQRFKDLRSREADAWDFAETRLNAFGYELLQEGQGAAAVTVFQLAADTYPASANAWDSLGEGLGALGRKDESLRAYRRSVELGPPSAGAKAALGMP